MKESRQTRLAEKILRDYCQMMNVTDMSLYGQPESLLGYSKNQIKAAIRVALSRLEPDETDLRETLIQSYMHLAQFIADKDADTTQRGQRAILSGDINHPDFHEAQQATMIINRIKSEMEELKIEIQAYVLKNIRKPKND